MNLRTLIFTKNACYKKGEKITPQGIMVHSTGENNPWLKRYIGPDDGLLGKNDYNNHWNQPMSRNVCVHGFIGKLADGSIATYQILPWNHRGWHCGSGNKGSGNDTYISFEICEDGLTDPTYFKKVYREAVELCTYLCEMYNFTEKNIICHSEAYSMGIASNHSDVMHWFPKHGKSMDIFRADVKALLAKTSAFVPSTTPIVSGTPSTGSTTDEKKIWDYFMDKLGNAYGVAGLMGNLNAESALRSNNLQQTYEQKLGYTDATYTSAVDDGSYGGFVKDCAGYGLAQWTYYTRKQKLLDYAKNKKKSIGDFDMQLDFLYKELSESYKAVWNDLETADSILVASNSVLLKFERPANQSESVQKKRAEYGKKYFDKYADKEATTTPTVPTTTQSLTFKKGDIVKFAGGKHYSSANAMSGVVVKASKAEITNIYPTGKHPYHCRAVNDVGAYISGVYGWVDVNTLSEIAVETKPVTLAGIKKGDIVSIAKGAKYYGGSKDVPDWVVTKQWIVAGVSGSRVVVDKSVDGKNSISSPIDAKYLTVVGADEPWTPKEGDIVIYNGNKHYANANAANGSTCKGGKAKITDIYQLGRSKHPYHLVRIAGSGATVYGWVDADTFTKAA